MDECTPEQLVYQAEIERQTFFLERFRADPSKVKVSIQHLRNGSWQVFVTSLVDRSCFSWIGANPEKALFAALEVAEGADMPGIDLGMSGIYDHPQKKRS